MNHGFSIIEVLVSLILLSLLSTSLLFFLEGYREIRWLEKNRFDAFREASALMESMLDSPPFCVEETKHFTLDSLGYFELKQNRLTEKASLVSVKIQVFSKTNKRLLSQLERVVVCQ